MLASALARARLHGLVTNRDLLVGDPARRGVPRRAGQHRLLRPAARRRVERTDRTRRRTCCFAAAVALAEDDRCARRVQAGVPVAWRNVVSQPQRTVFAVSTGPTE